MLKAMEAIEKRVVFKQAAEKSAILKAVEENAAVDVVEDDIKEMLKGCCCIKVHAVENLFM
jgi:hypothetical protein